MGVLVFLGGLSARATGGAVLTYNACCSAETLRLSPTGFFQGEAKTATVPCKRFESPSRCWLRRARETAKHSVRLLGAVSGSCGADLAYPAPVRTYPAFIPRS